MENLELGLKIKNIPLVGNDFVINVKVWSAAILLGELVISIGLPLIGLLTYMSYSSDGAHLESCCQGPECHSVF